MLRAKRLLLHVLTSRPISRVCKPFMRSRAAILVLHRLANRELGTSGHDPELLRRALAYLRGERYELLELRELFRRLALGETIRGPAVVFTMDDGYLEQASIAPDIFAAFDCPVTTFVTTGFLDGSLWFWWDQIEYILTHTLRPEVEVNIGETTVHYRRHPVAQYGDAQKDFIARCKRVPEQTKLAAIERLATALDVEVPTQPPLRYAPMSWAQVRALEPRGMTFAPHSVTHPILSRTGDEQSERELRGSWERLRACARSPVPIFAYPNGLAEDYGAREIATLKTLGLSGAVGGTVGYPGVRDFACDGDDHFRIPRLAYPDDLRLLTQYVNGLERLKESLRTISASRRATVPDLGTARPPSDPAPGEN